ncbi:glycosyltransferase, partial [Thermodesulfobacteriota bacterium]
MEKSVKRNRRAIIVIGMHRSGTSAIMRTLNLCGVDLGSNLLPPANDNEKGFWEHADIYRINEKFFADVNSSWDDVRTLPHNQWDSDIRKRYKKDILSVLESNFSDSRFWGIKDPRLCYLLPMWHNILERFDSKPYFLVIVRNPLEVIASLANRNGFSKEKSGLLWLKHLLESEKETRNSHRIFITYENLLNDWKEVVDQIQNSFKFTLPVLMKNASPKIEKFLNDSLRHHKVADVDLKKDPSLSNWIQKSYFAVTESIGKKENKLIKTLAAIDAKFHEAANLYDPVLNDLLESNLNISTKLQEQTQLIDQFAKDSELSDLQSTLRDELQVGRRKIISLQTTVEEKDRIMELKDSELSDLQSMSRNEIQVERSKITSLQTRVDEKDKMMELKDCELSELNDELQLKKDEITSLQSKALEQDGKLQQLVDEAANVNRKFSAYQKAITVSTSWKLTAPLRWISLNARILNRKLRLSLYFFNRQYITIKKSELFDVKYYLSKYPDVTESGINPLVHYIEFGASEGRNPNQIFNTAYYLSQNPDVADSRMNPLAHYILFGASEGRDPGSAKDINTGRLSKNQKSNFTHTKESKENINICTTLPTFRKYKILFLDGLGSSFESPRYRVSNIREALELVCVETGYTTQYEIYNNLEQLFGYDILVLFRAGWNDELCKIVGRCRTLKIPVVLDLDDYIFEPSIATEKFISGIRNWNKEQKEEYLHGVQAYRRTLLECDYFTASTDYIAERAKELGKESFVIYNGLNQELLNITSHLRFQQNSADSEIVEIVYISGTKTHQNDFAFIVPALLKILRENTNVHLLIIGHLDLNDFNELNHFKDRIKVIPFVNWRKIPEYLGKSQITIAPLEIGNPFCQGKSELKYFEGAAYGLITVATPTAPFTKAIIDGENGYLCETTGDWYNALTNLVTDKALRNRIKQNAIIDSINRYSPDQTAKQALNVYGEIVRRYRANHNAKDHSLCISWVAPFPFHGSGGHNDIFIAANEMVKRGHQVTIYFTEGAKTHSPKSAKEYIEKHFGYPINFDIVLGTNMIKSCDVLLATHHSTIRIINEMNNKAYTLAYFVQDYEPYFSPVGSEYFEAEMSYKGNIFAITLGKWLARTLKNNYGTRVRSIDFWVDRQYYYPQNGDRSNKSSTRTLIFFARPSMFRRCFSLGIEALANLHKKMPHVEIVMYGTDDLKNYNLDFPYIDKGILPIQELGKLYRSADLGLIFSTTNPSLVIFEAMACGLPVVDLDVLDSHGRHGKDYPAYLVQPHPEKIADGLRYLLNHTE